MGEVAYVLIVDDDIQLAEGTKLVLETAGHEVDMVHDTDQAAESIAQRRPDLIILDVMMRSEGEGFWFAQKLKNDSDLASIPVLMVTGASKELGMKFDPDTDGDYLPVDDFLDKPVDPTVLLEKVANLLN
ncbi:response regulator transcription factor [Candidatus Hydrogenedentota bacterium]